MQKTSQQKFLQVKQKLDYYHITGYFPIQATDLISKILKKLDQYSIKQPDPTLTSYSDLSPNIYESPNNQIILLTNKIKQLINQNNQLHLSLIKTQQLFDELKNCQQSITKQNLLNKIDTISKEQIIGSKLMKQRQQQLYNQLSETKYKYNELMDLIHEDNQIQRKYIKRLMKYKQMQDNHTQRNIVNIDQKMYKSPISTNIYTKKQSNQTYQMQLLKSKIFNRDQQIKRLHSKFISEFNIDSYLLKLQLKDKNKQICNLNHKISLLIENPSKNHKNHSSEFKLNIFKSLSPNLKRIKSPQRIQNIQNQKLINVNFNIKVTKLIQQNQKLKREKDILGKTIDDLKKLRKISFKKIKTIEQSKSPSKTSNGEVFNEQMKSGKSKSNILIIQNSQKIFEKQKEKEKSKVIDDKQNLKIPSRQSQEKQKPTSKEKYKATLTKKQKVKQRYKQKVKSILNVKSIEKLKLKPQLKKQKQKSLSDDKVSLQIQSLQRQLKVQVQQFHKLQKQNKQNKQIIKHLSQTLKIYQKQVQQHQNSHNSNNRNLQKENEYLRKQISELQRLINIQAEANKTRHGRTKRFAASIKKVDEDKRKAVIQQKLRYLQQDFFEDPNKMTQLDDDDAFEVGQGQPRRRKNQKRVNKRAKKQNNLKRNLNLRKIIQQEGLQLKTQPNFVNIQVGKPKYPSRNYCSICGNLSRSSCPRCGQRICQLKCSRIHSEIKCLNFEIKY